jgi:8-oxo-dGTP diphosphatase
MKAGVDYVGAGVGGILFNGRGEVLMLLRRRPPEAGSWEKPGGKVEPGETVESALKREFLEETGLEVEVVKLLNVVDQIREGQHWVAIDYMVKKVSGKLENREPEKIEKLGWFKLDALPGNLGGPMRSTAELLRNGEGL